MLKGRRAAGPYHPDPGYTVLESFLPNPVSLLGRGGSGRGSYDKSKLRVWSREEFHGFTTRFHSQPRQVCPRRYCEHGSQRGIRGSGRHVTDRGLRANRERFPSKLGPNSFLSKLPQTFPFLSYKNPLSEGRSV